MSRLSLPHVLYLYCHPKGKSHLEDGEPLLVPGTESIFSDEHYFQGLKMRLRFQENWYAHTLRRGIPKGFKREPSLIVVDHPQRDDLEKLLALTGIPPRMPVLLTRNGCFPDELTPDAVYANVWMCDSGSSFGFFLTPGGIVDLLKMTGAYGAEPQETH